MLFVFRSSSPDSLNAERNETKLGAGLTASPTALFKLIVPLLRCEVLDVRTAAVNALGNVNNEALKYGFLFRLFVIQLWIN